MISFLIEYEAIIRTTVFLSIFIILALGEYFSPLTKRKTSRLKQWFTNISILISCQIALKLLFPILAVGTAIFAQQNAIGLFNMVSLPALLVILCSLLCLDFIIYLQHRLMHRVPFLWRLHRMHHCELALDVSSAVRFHPIEIIISMLIKMLFVLVLGIPAAGVILFEILLNALALFNHSNLKLSRKWDNRLRQFLVTPEVHWIHHSQKIDETNSNYGFNLIIWDKLFSTYTAKPAVDYPVMVQGISGKRWQKPLNILQLLSLPFKRL